MHKFLKVVPLIIVLTISCASPTDLIIIDPTFDNELSGIIISQGDPQFQDLLDQVGRQPWTDSGGCQPEYNLYLLEDRSLSSFYYLTDSYQLVSRKLSCLQVLDLEGVLGSKAASETSGHKYMLSFESKLDARAAYEFCRNEFYIVAVADFNQYPWSAFSHRYHLRGRLEGDHGAVSDVDLKKYLQSKEITNIQLVNFGSHGDSVQADFYTDAIISSDDLEAFSIREEDYPFNLEIFVTDRNKWAKYLATIPGRHTVREIW